MRESSVDPGASCAGGTNVCVEAAVAREGVEGNDSGAWGGGGGPKRGPAGAEPLAGEDGKTSDAPSGGSEDVVSRYVTGRNNENVVGVIDELMVISIEWYIG